MASFASTIFVTNNLPFALGLEDKPVTRGHWVAEPLQSISPDVTTGPFRVEDDQERSGTEGSFTYSLSVPGMEARKWRVNFRCLPSETNAADFVVDSPVLFNVLKSFNSDGNPLMLHLVIEFKPIVTSVRITRLTLYKPNTAIKNSNGVINFGSSAVLWSTATAAEVVDNTTPGVTGSYIPAAFDLNAASADLSIELSSDPALADIPFQLIGHLSGLPLVSLERTSQGTRLKAAISARFTGTVWGYAGDIQWSWTFLPTSQAIDLGQTRVELYGVSSSLPPFLRINGIPVEFLRQVALPSPGVGFKTYIGRLLMNHFGYKYDIGLGAPRFTTSALGEEFRLDYWLAMIRNAVSIKCNGFDQAGLLQLGLSLQQGSQKGSWALMTPFGYLNKTRLVGWELCNNPFFKDDTSLKLLEQDDPRRTQFGSHSFVLDADRTMDSCLGPHRGIEMPSRYVTTVIDEETSLYESTGTAPGTEKDISRHQGILSLVAGSTLTQSSDFLGSLPAHLRDAVCKVLDTAANPSAPAAKYSNADISGITSLVLSAFPGELSHHSIDISPTGSESRYVFKLDAGVIELRIRLCTDHDAAVATFQRHISAYQALLTSIFRRPSNETAKGQLNLEADSLSVWVRDNGFFAVTVLLPGPSLDAITGKVDAYFAAASVDEQEVRKPDHWRPAAPFEFTEETRFVVKPEINTSTHVVASTTTGNVFLLSSSLRPLEFHFIAYTPGSDEIVLTFSHEKSLAVVVERVKVDIKNRA